MQTTILHEHSRHHEWQGSGSLSIKTFRGGQAYYTVAGGRHVVDDTCYFLLNQGQEYEICVDSPTPVESFCLFFAPGFAESVQVSFTTTTERLLADPAAGSTTPLHFYERTYPQDAELSTILLGLRSASTQQRIAPAWLEEQSHDLMARLLVLQRQIQGEVATLPYLRAATRDELYRRLYQVRDTLHATLDRPLPLAEMAQQAALSPNHLLRTFKQLFRQSPHQYHLQQRLVHAAHLLVNTPLAVTEISLAVGFESLGSFSWRFRRHFGQSPAAYRRAKG